LGRDVLSRLLVGARLALGTALLTSTLVTPIGIVLGCLAGFYGGLVDTVLMRLVDVVLAVPGLVLALAVSGLFEPSLLAVMLGLVTIWWAGYARVVRGLVLVVRERPFVEACRSTGASEWRVMTRHVVPNVVSPVIVLATLEIGQLILAVSGLTFLGLGAPPPTPEWGAMLYDGRTYFLSDPQLVLIPGLAISLAVLASTCLETRCEMLSIRGYEAVAQHRPLRQLVKADAIRKGLGSGGLCVTGENAGPAAGGVENGVHLVGARTVGVSKAAMFEFDAAVLPVLGEESNLQLGVQSRVVAPLGGDLPVE
jgi:ABC-type antimicrobial peptide transport system permease subunit